MVVGQVEGYFAYFFLVMQALIVVFEDGLAFCFAAVVFGVCVGHVACEDFLPEGEAAGWACDRWVSNGVAMGCIGVEKEWREAAASGGRGMAVGTAGSKRI